MSTAAAKFNLTSKVAERWEGNFIHGDPLKERTDEHFQKEAEVVDTLVAQVFTLEEESKTQKLVETAPPATITQ